MVMMKDLVILYFLILCIIASTGCVIAIVTYNRVKIFDDRVARQKLVKALLNFGVALISFIIVLLNI